MKKKISELELIKEAHKLTFENREQLRLAEKYGCIYCTEIFSELDFDDDFHWVDDNNTALCPFCGIDALIPETKGYPLSKDFLQKSRDYWFGTDDDPKNRHLESLMETRIPKYMAKDKEK